MKLQTLLSLVATMAVAWTCPAAVTAVTGVQAVDGESFRLKDARIVRCLGLASPNKDESGAAAATTALNALVSNRELRMEPGRPDKDTNGHVLAYVFDGRILVNEELVRQGWAHVCRPVSAKYRQRLLAAQEEARAAGRGIWAGLTNALVSIAEVKPRSTGGTEALHDEYVVLQNRGSNAVDLTGWSVIDEGNHRYLFPQFMLAPGAKATLRSGVGRNIATDLYWGSRTPIWNNNGDSLTLKNAQGRLVVTYVY